MSVCIIPARGGSQRIPGKNVKDFRGKPMLHRAIETAKKTMMFTKHEVWVSTDSEDVADVARAGGGLVIMRPKELGQNHVGTQEVMRHAVKILALHRPDTVCCLYPCSPLLSPADLLLGHDLLTHKHAYTMSVGTDPLCDAGNFYWGWAGSFMADVPLIGPDTVMVPIDKDRVCDINTPEDWLRAETLFDNLKEK